MRVWFGYDGTGALRSVEMHGKGWPEQIDFLTSALPTVVRIRNERAAQGITGFVAYDCPCPGTEQNCVCHNDKFGGSYVVDGQLTTKPATQLVVNGVVGSGDLGSILFTGDVAVKLTGAAPDGTEVTLVLRGMAGSSQPITLTFTGGETNEHTQDVRAYGPMVSVYAVGRLIQPHRAVLVR